MPVARHGPGDVVDPDPRFTSRGGRASYTSPWDYLFVAIMLIGLAVGFTVFFSWDAATDLAMREKMQHPAALMLLVPILGPGAVGGWALRRFVRWRRARHAYAAATGTPYRTIFKASTF